MRRLLAVGVGAVDELGHDDGREHFLLADSVSAVSRSWLPSSSSQVDTGWGPLILSVPTGSLAGLAAATDTCDFGNGALDFVVSVTVNFLIHGRRVAAVVVHRDGIRGCISEIEFRFRYQFTAAHISSTWKPVFNTGRRGEENKNKTNEIAANKLQLCISSENKLHNTYQMAILFGEPLEDFWLSTAADR